MINTISSFLTNLFSTDLTSIGIVLGLILLFLILIFK